MCWPVLGPLDSRSGATEKERMRKTTFLLVEEDHPINNISTRWAFCVGRGAERRGDAAKIIGDSICRRRLPSESPFLLFCHADRRNNISETSQKWSRLFKVVHRRCKNVRGPACKICVLSSRTLGQLKSGSTTIYLEAISMAVYRVVQHREGDD